VRVDDIRVPAQYQLIDTSQAYAIDIAVDPNDGAIVLTTFDGWTQDFVRVDPCVPHIRAGCTLACGRTPATATGSAPNDLQSPQNQPHP
jgi:hypothetical protein